MRVISDNLNLYKNYFFVGEAGSGKSEIAINYALQIKKLTNKTVHFFDLDMTKPLFRSRELETTLKDNGIVMHFEEQFFDAPTLVGGIRTLLKDETAIVIMDVGGDYIGARSIGGFSKELNKDNCLGYYVVNSYRPWSMNIENIDKVLGSVLGVSRVKLEKLSILSNPNIGPSTTKDDVIIGHQNLLDMVSEYKDVAFLCCEDNLAVEVEKSIGKEIFHLKIYLNYPWNE